MKQGRGREGDLASHEHFHFHLNGIGIKESCVVGFHISHFITISKWAESTFWWFSSLLLWGNFFLLCLICYFMSRSATKVERQPKLFFVSTSATTTTLQTASVCYSTSGAPSAACTGRRKRSINIDGVPLADVKPSQLNQEVQTSQDAKLDREGRFLLYWITTTSISTSTSYTTTIKISAATCTPAVNIGWGICWYSTRLIMLFLFVLFDWYIFWNPWHISLFLLIYSLFNVGPANIDREFYKGCLFGY